MTFSSLTFLPVAVLVSAAPAVDGPDAAKPTKQTEAGAETRASTKAGIAKGARAKKARPEKVIDQGTFAVTIAGRRVGKEAFSVIETGEGVEIRTTTQFWAGKGSPWLKGTLKMDARFRPLAGQFDWRVDNYWKRARLGRSGSLPELTTEGPPRTVYYTRPGKTSDLFLLNNPLVLAHLIPLCRMAGPKEQTLTAFPSAPLRISAAQKQSFPQTRMGAPALELSSVVVDLAQSQRFELVCDGSALIAFRQNGRALVAVRASYESVASALQARTRSKPPVPVTIADLPRAIAVPTAAGSPAATLACTFAVPRTHADLRKDKSGAILPLAAPHQVGSVVFRPETPDALPAVLLLGDAGIHDADGDPVGPGESSLSILKLLAIRLGEANIASLRCADRGAERKRRAPSHISVDALASDARVLLAALRREGAVDPERVAIAGHGEGGFIASLAAARDPKVRALALLAAPGRPLDALILEQAEASMKRFGYPEEVVRAAVTEEKAVYDAVRARKPLPKTLSRAERKAMQDALPWLRSHLAYDPAAVIAKITELPVLIAQGGRDVKVGVESAEILSAALTKAGNSQVTVKLYPELNHPFATTPSGSLADYLDPRAEMADSFLVEFAAFAAQALARRPQPLVTRAGAEPRAGTKSTSPEAAKLNPAAEGPAP